MKIGLLGAGRMGSAIGRRLIESGHELRIWNRTRERAEALAKEGATIADTPLEAARGAEVVLSTLADDHAMTAAVLEGRSAAIHGLDAGDTHVSMCTISPTLSAELARAHAERNQNYVAAPVLGRPEAAAHGELVALPAGPANVIEQCRPIFLAVAKATHVVGTDPPRANVVKLAANFAIAATLEILGEAYALVEGYGVSDETFLEIVNDSMLASPVFADYGARIAKDAFEPAGFRLDLGLKDMRLVLDAGEARAVAMPIASLLRDRFIEAVQLGMSGVDWSAMARAARKHEKAA